MLKVTSTTTLSFYKTDGFTVDTVALLRLDFFFMFTVYSEKTTTLHSPHCFIFSLFLFVFFCSFFKMQVERRAFNGLSTIPDSPAWNFSMNFEQNVCSLLVEICLKRLQNRCVWFQVFFFFWKERENRGNVYDPRITVNEHLKTQKSWGQMRTGEQWDLLYDEAVL